MSDSKPPNREPAHGIFAHLADRPTPELDSERLWRRIEARLAPRGASLWRRLRATFAATPAPLRVVGATIGFAAVGLLVWAGIRDIAPGAGAAPQFVELTPADDGGSPPPVVGEDVAEVRLDVRLVRGYDGALPADVRGTATRGAGGADPIADARRRMADLLPFEHFGVVGSWTGSVASDGDIDVQLSDAYRLLARAADATGGSILRLDDLELAGAGGAATGDMNLAPGRLYMLGVLSPGAATPDLVLLIRAEPVTAEGR